MDLALALSSVKVFVIGTWTLQIEKELKDLAYSEASTLSADVLLLHVQLNSLIRKALLRTQFDTDEALVNFLFSCLFPQISDKHAFLLWLRFRVGPDLQIGIFDEGGSLKTEFDDVSDTDNLENTDAVGVEKLLLIAIQWIDTINAATMAKSTQNLFSFVGPNQ